MTFSLVPLFSSRIGTPYKSSLLEEVPGGNYPANEWKPPRRATLEVEEFLWQSVFMWNQNQGCDDYFSSPIQIVELDIQGAKLPTQSSFGIQGAESRAPKQQKDCLSAELVFAVFTPRVRSLAYLSPNVPMCEVLSQIPCDFKSLPLGFVTA